MKFFKVTKPGIIFGNIISLLGGLSVGAKLADYNFINLFFTVIGLATVIASACVFNSIVDRDIDKLMERTKNRPLVTGTIKPKLAIYYASLLGAIGFSLLIFVAGYLATAISFFGYCAYLIGYTLLLKRISSWWGVIVGGLAGAVPPVVGYTSVTHSLDKGALILYLILLVWQMPHFYAISIFRIKDFSRAKIASLPLSLGISKTKIIIVIYIACFTIVSTLLTIFGYAGIVYFAVALITGGWWFIKSIISYNKLDDRSWARQVFFLSIINIMILNITLVLEFII